MPRDQITPRVFLGTLAIVPRTDLKKVDEWGMFHSEDLGSQLRNSLSEIFTLPLAKDVREPKSTDLALDVIIPSYQAGSALSVDLGDIGFPLFWRPKLEVRARLYGLQSKKTTRVFAVTEKLGWSSYISRLFTWHAIFRFRPMFDKADMEYLLYQACGKLLQEIKNAIN